MLDSGSACNHAPEPEAAEAKRRAWETGLARARRSKKLLRTPHHPSSSGRQGPDPVGPQMPPAPSSLRGLRQPHGWERTAPDMVEDGRPAARTSNSWLGKPKVPRSPGSVHQFLPI